ncbi:MAG: MTH1187 family thiamine-binding protein [Desulfovibrionaceae bacterium]
MSCVATLSIFPISGEAEHLGPFVARAVEVIRESGLPYQLGPMGTAFEGGFDEVMAVASRCMKVLEPDFERIYMTLAVDNRRGGADRIEGKVRSVAEALERNAKKA